MDGLVWTETSGVPAGPHTGEFSGVEPFENEHGAGAQVAVEGHGRGRMRGGSPPGSLARSHRPRTHAAEC